ncbi:MAG: DUF3168 domain-containing protein [Qingshengfaniella sp.]
MSYRDAGDLQAAIHARLTGDTALMALVAGAVFDAVPEGRAPDVYLALGAEEVTETRDHDGAIMRHRIDLSAIGKAESFAQVKAVAAAAEAALRAAPLTAPGLNIMDMWLERVRATRGKHPARRRIDMRITVLLDQN